MRTIILFAVCIAVCYLVGFASAAVQADAISQWYPTLNKPALTPPNIVFPIAWNILYFLMGISLGLVVQTHHPRKPALIALFAAQLALTFVWCLVFFAWRNPAAGLAVIVLLLLIVIAYTIMAWPVRRAAALLFIPYILWVAFATYLNAYIWMNN